MSLLKPADFELQRRILLRQAAAAMPITLVRYAEWKLQQAFDNPTRPLDVVFAKDDYLQWLKDTHRSSRQTIDLWDVMHLQKYLKAYGWETTRWGHPDVSLVLEIE